MIGYAAEADSGLLDVLLGIIGMDPNHTQKKKRPIVHLTGKFFQKITGFLPCGIIVTLQQKQFPLGKVLVSRRGIRPRTVMGAADHDRICQLMNNLIGNALKYSEAGGGVTIRLHTDAGELGFVQVQITDTGCGIPQRELKTIFKKFRRIDSGQDTERGTGLGLSIAKHIVMAHGGRIWATSQPGHGSAFYFTLPVV